MEFIFYIFLIGIILFILIVFGLLAITDNNKKDVIIDKRQNVKIGNTWVTIQSNDNEPIWTDYEIELRNEIDNAYIGYINSKDVLNDDEKKLLKIWINQNKQYYIKFITNENIKIVPKQFL